MLRVKTKIVEKGFHANNNKVYIFKIICVYIYLRTPLVHESKKKYKNI
jgi:hypothetical protein